MKLRAWFLRLLGLLLAALLPGCELAEKSFTYKVWHTDDFRHVRGPATNPDVAVFYAPERKDFLVAYNSIRDGADAPRRQSYFVLQNEELVASRKKPAFASSNGLEVVAVPVNGATNVFPHALFDQRLIIHTAESQFGPYPLPDYEESSGVLVKSALSPLTIAGDATCVGLILGVFAAYAYAGGGCCAR